MAKHEIRIHENPTATKDAAKFLGSYITKGTTTPEALCRTASELNGMPLIKLQTLIENDIDAFIALEREGACRIHVDGGSIELRIHLCTDDAGAKILLFGAMGVEYPYEIVKVINRQNVVCRTVDELEPGDYKCVILSRGGDPENDLQSDFRKVKVLKAATPPGPAPSTDPVFTKVFSSHGEGTVTANATFTGTGSNLAKQAGDTLIFRHLYVNEGDEQSRDYPLGDWAVSADGTQLTATCPPLMAWGGDRAEVVLTRGGVTAKIGADLVIE